MKRLAFVLALVLWTALLAPAEAARGDTFSALGYDWECHPNCRSADIAWDGVYFWQVDPEDDDIFAYSPDGTYHTDLTIDLTSANARPGSLAWDGTYFYVGDIDDNKVYAYTGDGTYTSSRTFSGTLPTGVYHSGMTWDGTYLWILATNEHVYAYDSSLSRVTGVEFELISEHDHASGIAWDGTYFLIPDYTDDKVYVYNSSGSHQPTLDFSLGANEGALEWDGTLLWVLNSAADNTSVYEGPTAPPTDNYGLPSDFDYQVAFSATAQTHDDWKCIQSSSGSTFTVYNSPLTVQGFCVQNTSSQGMEVELHLSASSSYAALTRFAEVTGAWSFVETGVYAMYGLRIYDDTYTPTDRLAFTEETGGLAESNRLGFTTMAKSVTDTDCEEATDGTGFACSRSRVTDLSDGDKGVLLFSLAQSNSVDYAGRPNVPDSVQVSRNADYTVATVTWELYDIVTAYEVQRHTAVLVDVADATRIEYGDPVTYRVVGTVAGVREYVDPTVEAHRTYQFRVRGRGAAGDSWSDWSELVFSGAEPKVDLSPPGNLGLAHMGSSITASWTAPPGDFDNYTLQRQELVIVEGSTFFANVETLSATGSVWLPVDPTVYDDTHIIPSQTYEYRIAAVLDNQVGVYSDWFRIGPPNTSLGAAPANFQFLTSGARVLDARREYWMSWDATSGADDYEVQVLILKLRAVQRVESRIVTDTTYFRTAFGRSAFRVRGRKVDEKICGSAVDDRCLTEWTGWFGMPFTPKAQIPAPPTATPATSTLNLRTEMEGVIESVLGESTGADVNGGYVLQFLMLLMAVVVSAMTIAITWRRGMAPLGVGMACTISILIFFAGYRLFGTPLAWAVALQLLVAAAGLFALVRQVGVFR